MYNGQAITDRPCQEISLERANNERAKNRRRPAADAWKWSNKNYRRPVKDLWKWSNKNCKCQRSVEWTTDDYCVKDPCNGQVTTDDDRSLEQATSKYQRLFEDPWNRQVTIDDLPEVLGMEN